MEFLKFNLLLNEPGIIHFVTTRRGGISEEKYKSLNLSLKVNDLPENVLENRERLANSLSLRKDKLIFPDQCHTDHIKEVLSSTSSDELVDTDGLMTREKGLCLCILAADCVPVILYDPVQQTVSALHAGWRGTYGQIVPKAVKLMTDRFGSMPENILACIGPAISHEHYEVGDEVALHFHELFDGDPKVIKSYPGSGKDRIDLKEANRILLLRAGLSDEHIEMSSVCTFNSPELFFSARRDGIDCGRFATGIMLV